MKQMLTLASMANSTILSTSLDFFDNRKPAGVLNLIKNAPPFSFRNLSMACCSFMYPANQL